MKYIADIIFDIALKTLRFYPPTQQKAILTEAYETEKITAQQLEYAINKMGLINE